VTSFGGSEQVSASTFAPERVGCGAVSGERVLSRGQALDTLLGKGLLPSPNGGSADASLPSHLLHLQALGREQDNVRLQDVLEGAGSISAIAKTANSVASFRSKQTV